MNLKKTLFVVLFSSLAMGNGISLFLSFSAFKFDQQRIEEAFCVNKEKADLACGGQCYFMKKMEKFGQETESRSMAFFGFENFIGPLYFVKVKSNRTIDFCSDQYFDFVSHNTSEGFSSSLLRPPESENFFSI